MKVVLILILIHVFAYSVSKAAEEMSQPAASQVSEQTAATAKIDDCRDLLPQVESDYRDLDYKYKSLSQSIGISQENYLVSFNQMTEVLFQVTQAREEDTQRISQSRDQLKTSLQQFNVQKNEDSAKKLQDTYLDLTVRIYSALMDSQKILDGLKTQLSQVESSRSQFANSKQELEGLDHQKLAIEAKLINLKIKCQPDKRY